MGLRRVMPAALIVAAAFGALWASGADPISALRSESSDWSSGNLPYFLTLFGLDPRKGPLGAAVVVATILGIIVASFLASRASMGRGRPEAICHALVGSQMAMMLVSRKAYTNYLELTFLPLCLVIPSLMPSRMVPWFLSGLGALAVIEPSMWFRWLSNKGLYEALFTVPSARLACFLIIDLALVAAYAGVLAMTVGFGRRQSGVEKIRIRFGGFLVPGRG